ncbi:Sec-independent protein translocase subunit TatA [Amycolatopsis orientalis]|uniref:Sec-independent protein translocase subunit TatA n=1 Tax=Amycolatopsis orientalis TaxID=31958 RepID=UPI0003A7A22A|nr:Sec-independent protein translocase subunit TatA [Amycolatopsis orientalis]
MNALQPWHIIVLVLVVVLLFGAKRLPDAARSIGKSMKIFKAETKDLTGEQKAEAEAESADTRHIAAPAQTSHDQQVADLQRQLDELKKQQAAQSDQPQKNAS